jgi:proteasome lid subunit RPN8/RPN11
MAKGLELIGFFHSHPRGPAAPSQFDTDRAWPGYVYLILGLEAPADARVRAWVLDENGRFGEHPVGLVD